MTAYPQDILEVLVVNECGPLAGEKREEKNCVKNLWGSYSTILCAFLTAHCKNFLEPKTHIGPKNPLKVCVPKKPQINQQATKAGGVRTNCSTEEHQTLAQLAIWKGSASETTH